MSFALDCTVVAICVEISALFTGGVDPGGWGFEHLKYVGRVRVCFDPLLKDVTFFHSNQLLDNSASFTSSRMKDFCQKWKVKLIFRSA